MPDTAIWFRPAEGSGPISIYLMARGRPWEVSGAIFTVQLAAVFVVECGAVGVVGNYSER
jgi:hypothetical protein